MKYLLIIITCVIFNSCNNNTDTKSTTVSDSNTTDAQQNKTQTDTILLADTIVSIPETKLPEEKQDPIPADGHYRYDMAFSEFQGKTMGEKVTVIIKADSIKIVYEGDGKLSAAKGTVMDAGIIVKHKSGVYIIAHNTKDAKLDVFGGCSGGPTVIDFIHKKYWTC